MAYWFDSLGTIAAEVVALNARERWAATKRLNISFMSENWFLVFGIIMLVVLTVILVWVSFVGLSHRRRASTRLFVEDATKRGLSAREREILAVIADKSGLENSDGIFTLEDAFSRGAAKLIEQSRLQQGQEVSERLMGELSSLSEKLGFLAQGQSPAGVKLNSRQIPVGKKLHLTRRASRSPDTIEATVVENDMVELTVKLKVPVKVIFGEMWRVRYYFEASVWEFDTSVISYDGGVLVLKHSDNIRFVNRRRFMRVPVKNLAFLARFPFTRLLSPTTGGAGKGAATVNDLAQVSWEGWKPVEFIPAVVTELAGPGLRVEAPLDVKAGERILVMFKLDAARDETQSDAEGVAARIIEDIGVVRRIEKTAESFSIGIEMVGLSDSDIGELIRVANAVSAKVNGKGETEAVAGGETEEDAEATMTVRGG